MKNLKLKIVGSTLAIALICGGYLGLTAMNNQKVIAAKTLTQEWFVFTSPLNPDNSGYEDALKDPANYSPIESSEIPSECPRGNEKVCSILVTPNPSEPQSPQQSDLEDLIHEMTNPDPNSTSIVFKPQDN